MMTAEHRRPFAAFMLLLAFACAVMANGLRDQVVKVFVSSGAPRPLISAVLPDIVLGQTLRNTPQPEPAAESADESGGAVREVEPSSSATALTQRVVTLVRSTSRPVRATPASSRRGGHTAHHPPAASNTPGKPNRPAPQPSVVPLVPIEPVPVPRPPLTPSTPGIGVDVPTSNGGGHGFGHGNKPSKGFTSSTGGHGRSSGADGKRAHPADRGHGPSIDKGHHMVPATSWDHGNRGSSGDSTPGWQGGDRVGTEHRSSGWRSDGHVRGHSDHNRVRHSDLGNRGHGHVSRVRGAGAKGRGPARHDSHPSHRRGHASHGGGHGKGH